MSAWCSCWITVCVCTAWLSSRGLWHSSVVPLVSCFQNTRCMSGTTCVNYVHVTDVGGVAMNGRRLCSSCAHNSWYRALPVAHWTVPLLPFVCDYINYVCEYNRIVLTMQAPDDLYLIHACIGLLPITCYNLWTQWASVVGIWHLQGFQIHNLQSNLDQTHQLANRMAQSRWCDMIHNGIFCIICVPHSEMNNLCGIRIVSWSKCCDGKLGGALWPD